MKLVHADHVLLGDAPPITDGAIAIEDSGVIAEVGKASDLLPAHSGVEVTRVRGVVFPGLVNAHTHLELSWMRGRVPGGYGFVPWVEGLIATRPECTAEEEEEGIAAGLDELVASATVAVGDITNTLGAVQGLARRGIRGSVFHEVFGMNHASVLRRIEGLRAEVDERVPTWPDGLTYSPAPHTIFTTHLDAVKALIASALSRGLRTSLHLAEHAAERRAVEHGDGPFVSFATDRLKLPPADYPKRPLFDVAADVGALAPGVLLAHLTDAKQDELARVAKSGASVVACPRSNLYIEGKLPPILAMRAEGIEVALGTDSLASNTSLDVLAEAKAVHDRFPTIPTWEVLKMATWNGAVALGLSDVGRIAKGARPGVFAIEVETSDAGKALLSSGRVERRRVG